MCISAGRRPISIMAIYHLAVVVTALAILANINGSSGQSVEEKVKTLQRAITRHPILRLNGDMFKQLVKSGPKNYSIILMLTALVPQRGCQICGFAYEEYEILADSYRNSYMHAKQLYFTLADFDEAQDVFSSLGLNTAPVILHFPATGGRQKGDTMDLGRMGFDADSMAKWILGRTNVQIQVTRPVDVTGPLIYLLIAIMIGGLVYVKRDSLHFLCNRNLWGVGVLMVIFVFLSGQMWNNIRGPPMMHRNPRTGEMIYISGSSQFQFVAETYIVFGLYAAVTCGMIMMNEVVDAKISSSKKRVLIFVGLAIVVVFFSQLLSTFRAKYGGYPYSFLFS